jgi:hypothetical protein
LSAVKDTGGMQAQVLRNEALCTPSTSDSASADMRGNQSVLEVMTYNLLQVRSLPATAATRSP